MNLEHLRSRVKRLGNREADTRGGSEKLQTQLRHWLAGLVSDIFASNELVRVHNTPNIAM